MSDWGPIFVAVVLFVLLTPGLLFQVPGRNGCVDFGNFQTSGASILIHSLLYFGLICTFLLAVKVHLYLGWPLYKKTKNREGNIDIGCVFFFFSWNLSLVFFIYVLILVIE